MNEVESKKKGKGCLVGCSVGCLVVLILLGVIGFLGYRFVKKQYDSVIEQFEAEGYQTVEGQIIDMTDPVQEPTIFIAQDVTLRQGSMRGVALLTQTAELHGRIKGNVRFVGQSLVVAEDAILMQDLEVTAQTVVINGVVEGEVKGIFQQISGPGAPVKDSEAE
jgi:hypothetical protein